MFAHSVVQGILVKLSCLFMVYWFLDHQRNIVRWYLELSCTLHNFLQKNSWSIMIMMVCCISDRHCHMYVLWQFRVVLERTVQCSRTVRFFVMFDMFEVRYWAKMWCSEMFEVWSCCYVTRLVLELTVLCSQTVQCSILGQNVMFLESSMFRHSMFRVFKVRYFGVRSKTSG